MKRWLWLLIVPVIAVAGSNKGDLASLRQAVTLQLRAKTSVTVVVSNAVIDNALNRGLAEVCDKFPALEKFDTIWVNSSSEGAALNADFNRIHQVFRIGGDTTRIPIPFKSFDSLGRDESTIAASTDKKTGLTSIKYFYTFGDRILFHPKSGAISPARDSFLVLYFADDAILDSTIDTVKIKAAYIEKVILYACAQICANPMVADWNAAQFFMGEFATGMPPKIEREPVEKR